MEEAGLTTTAEAMAAPTVDANTATLGVTEGRHTSIVMTKVDIAIHPKTIEEDEAKAVTVAMEAMAAQTATDTIIVRITADTVTVRAGTSGLQEDVFRQEMVSTAVSDLQEGEHSTVADVTREDQDSHLVTEGLHSETTGREEAASSVQGRKDLKSQQDVRCTRPQSPILTSSTRLTSRI